MVRVTSHDIHPHTCTHSFFIDCSIVSAPPRRAAAAAASLHSSSSCVMSFPRGRLLPLLAVSTCPIFAPTRRFCALQPQTTRKRFSPPLRGPTKSNTRRNATRYGPPQGFSYRPYIKKRWTCDGCKKRLNPTEPHDRFERCGLIQRQPETNERCKLTQSMIPGRRSRF